MLSEEQVDRMKSSHGLHMHIGLKKRGWGGGQIYYPGVKSSPNRKYCELGEKRPKFLP